MLVHEARVRGRRLTCRPREVVQHGVNSDAVRLDLDDEWSGLARVTLVMSKGGLSTAVSWDGEPLAIPWDLMEEPGPLHLTVVGRTGSDVRVVTARMQAPMQVVPSGDLDGTHEPGDPALDEVQQAIEDARDAASEAREAAGRCRTISCGPGGPGSGGVAGDLYIDTQTGELYRLESNDG